MDIRQAERTVNMLVMPDQNLVDLSLTGARLRVSQKLTSGTVLKLRIFSKIGSIVNVTGKVNRIYEPKKGVLLAGVQFTDITSKGEADLQSILEQYGKGIGVSVQILG